MYNFYSLLSDKRLLGKNHRFMNFGYWPAHSHDEAAKKLALRLAKFADLQSQQTILSAGCGYGEDVDFWQSTFQLDSAIGINNYFPHLQQGKADLQNTNVFLSQASAVSLPFKANSFDSILALESALHFQPKEQFFKEAYAALKPGGTLALGDIILSKSNLTLRQKISLFISTKIAQVPVSNWIDWTHYEKRLKETGFTDIEFQDVSKHVIKGFAVYLERNLKNITWDFKWSYLLLGKDLPLAYMLIKAKKPVSKTL